MRRIKHLSSMTLGKDFGYLIAVCSDDTIWTRAFPVDDDWHQIDEIMDDDEIYMHDYTNGNLEADAN
jgi:hypothetical protein